MISLLSLGLIAALIAVAILYAFIYPRIYYYSLRNVPGPPGTLLFGNMWEIITGVFTMDTALVDDRNFMRDHPHLFKRWFFFIRPFLTACSGDAAREVLKTADPKGMLYEYLLPWLGEGLLISRGERWKKHRRLLTPAFHYKILRGFVNVFEKHCNVLAMKWEALGDDEEIDVQQYIHSLTLDIIGECAFGYQINSQREMSEYAKAIFECTELFVKRVYNVAHRYDWVYHLSENGKQWKRCLEIVHALPERVIRERIQRRSEMPSSGEEGEYDEEHCIDFLDILLDATTDEGGKLTLEDVRSEVDTFMFEGHDTTGSGLTWAIYLIASHPEVQQKIVDELEEVLGDRSFPADRNEVQRLTYLNAVVKETLRLYPPVPFVSRKSDELTEVMGYKIPKGTNISVSVNAIHRNPLHWKNPDDFMPERWTEEQDADRHAFSYLPFSGGPRNCIGQQFAQLEEVCVLASILKRFEVSFVAGQTILPVFSTVLRPKYGVKIRVKRR